MIESACCNLLELQFTWVAIYVNNTQGSVCVAWRKEGRKDPFPAPSAGKLLFVCWRSLTNLKGLVTVDACVTCNIIIPSIIPVSSIFHLLAGQNSRTGDYYKISKNSKNFLGNKTSTRSLSIIFLLKALINRFLRANSLTQFFPSFSIEPKTLIIRYTT